jgi:hypothetical protein
MVNVDIVYKTVLYILNKEQRGYITPDEFNKLGIQVQREIFEQYFEELNQQLRIPQTDSEYANRIKNLEEKIDIFKTFAGTTYNSTTTPNTPYFELPEKLHRLGTLIYNEKEIQGVNRNQYFLINKSPLTKPTESNPLYVLEGTGSPSAAPSQVYIYPDSIASGVEAYYIKAPEDPRWGYTLGSAGQYLYNSAQMSALIANRDMVASISQNTTIANPGSYTGNIGSTQYFTTSGNGLDAEITVIVGSGGDVTNVIVDYGGIGTNLGSGFNSGDTITVSSLEIGGSTDLIISLTPSDLLTDTTQYSQNFELHPSEQTNIILNILMYSGVIIRDPQIVQSAGTLIQQDEALEKQ